MTTETKATPEQIAQGRDAAILVGMNALMATHPNRNALRTLINAFAADHRANAFDNAEGPMVRDKFDGVIGMFVGIIDKTSEVLEAMATEEAAIAA